MDVTKTWPADVFPMQPVGRMVLNRNPDNFFAENEQVCRHGTAPALTFFWAIMGLFCLLLTSTLVVD